MGQTWLVASGKGGVGKSTLCAALVIALAKAGQSVAILDAVIGLRNQDSLLGMADRVVYDLVDVLEKNCDVEQALIHHSQYPNLSLLPAAQFCSMNRLNPKDMRKLVGALRVRYDYVLIDSPTGVEKGFLNALDPAEHVLLVVTPDDVSLRDAERASQVINEHKGPRPELIVNRANREWISDGIMYSPETVAMTLDLRLIGIVPNDDEVYRGILTHTDWMAEKGEAEEAVSRIAQRMMGHSVSLPVYQTNNGGFFNRLKRKRGENLL